MTPEPKPLTGTEPIVMLTAEQLRGLMRDAVVDALEGGPAQGAVLLTRAELAGRLGCSLATVQKLQGEGCPSVRLGDSPRFELDKVLGWLRERDRQRAEQQQE